LGAVFKVWCFFATRQLWANGICLEIYRTIDAHHAINTLRIAAVVLASKKSGTNRSTRSEMVRIFFHDNPKRFMTEYPGKVFAVIGPFHNRHDRPDLQETCG
jgi:hypothetical protein